MKVLLTFLIVMAGVQASAAGYICNGLNTEFSVSLVGQDKIIVAGLSSLEPVVGGEIVTYNPAKGHKGEIRYELNSCVGSGAIYAIVSNRMLKSGNGRFEIENACNTDGRSSVFDVYFCQVQ
jgi:hypothetical protein